EDGIRDFHVTGVQTCALPICTRDARNAIAPSLPRRCSARAISDRIEYLSMDSELLDLVLTWDQTGVYEVSELQSVTDEVTPGDRSEERRVGKESRGRRWQDVW